MFAGTSTGSIIALGLAAGLSMDDINQMYNVSNAQDIFTSNKGIFEIDGINAPRYQGRNKSRVLQFNLGQTTLARGQ